MKKNQNGFGAIEVILIVVILAVVAGLGWIGWRSFHNKLTKDSQSNTTVQKPVSKSSSSTLQATTCGGSYTDDPSKVSVAAGYTKYSETNSHITYNQPDSWGSPSVTPGGKNENRYADGQLVPSFLASIQYKDLYLTISTVRDYYYYARFVGWDYNYDTCAKKWTYKAAPENETNDQYKDPVVELVNNFPAAEFEFGDAGSGSVTYSLPINNAYIFSFMAAGDYVSPEHFDNMKSQLKEEVKDFLDHNTQFTS